MLQLVINQKNNTIKGLVWPVDKHGTVLELLMYMQCGHYQMDLLWINIPRSALNEEKNLPYLLVVPAYIS